jgi:citrate/tricarballylate utilization protein
MSLAEQSPAGIRAALAAEGARMMTICNACRYCEGYCAVFPAMERRLEFAWTDMTYMANLCHGCGECFFACQFAPPHAFNVNIPQNLAQIRQASYRKYAWPQPIARAFDRNAVGTAILLVACIAGAMGLAAALLGSGDLFAPRPDGNFYHVVPHAVMAGAFGAVGLLVLIAVVVGCARAWRDLGETSAELARPFAWTQALTDVFSLKYLSGDGDGCSTTDLYRSQSRRHAHHLTFYGFLLCFAATVTGTLYHYALGWHAPYELTSLPVVLGTVGGVGLLVGPPLLYFERRRADQVLFDKAQDGLANALIVLLFLASLTGLMLTALRQSPAMAVLLIVHLAVIMTLFVTIPYGKFIHGFYRLLALVKYALEGRRPTTVVGGDAG